MTAWARLIYYRHIPSEWICRITSSKLENVSIETFTGYRNYLLHQFSLKCTLTMLLMNFENVSIHSRWSFSWTEEKTLWSQPEVEYLNFMNTTNRSTAYWLLFLFCRDNSSQDSLLCVFGCPVNLSFVFVYPKHLSNHVISTMK